MSARAIIILAKFRVRRLVKRKVATLEMRVSLKQRARGAERVEAGAETAKGKR